MSEIVGVIGAKGDLGSQVVALLKKSGFSVLENDIAMAEGVSLEEMLTQATVIHFCIPADVVPFIGEVDALLVLHDSVMSSSEQASLDQTNNRAVPVHMLMNDTATVVVCQAHEQTQAVTDHFIALGQQPRLLTVTEHDRLMARTQAPLVILINELLEDLRTWREQGLLTPSAEELLDSLESRAAHWTPTTIRSILKNKEIDRLIDDMKSRRNEQEHSKSLSNEPASVITNL